MIVPVRLPKGKTKVSYGLIKIAVCDGGLVDVPEYVAQALLDAGCTKIPGEPVSNADPIELIAQGPVWETGFIMHAVGEHYSRLPKGYDKRVHAVALRNRYAPVVRFS